MSDFKSLWHANSRGITLLRRLVLLAALVAVTFGSYKFVTSFKDLADEALASVSDNIAGAYFNSLHVPINAELPPSATSFAYGPRIASVIGGKGEGLDCSIPPALNGVFRIKDGEMSVSLVFRQACVSHDMCYRHGLATYGYTQADCDFAFQEAASRICYYDVRERFGFAKRMNADGSSEDSTGSEAEENALHECIVRSKKALLGVRFAGWKPYKGWDQSTYFEYENLPHRSFGYHQARTVPTGENGRAAEKLLRIRTRPVGANIAGGPTLPLDELAMPGSALVGDASKTWLWFLQRRDLNNTLVTMTSLDMRELDRHPKENEPARWSLPQTRPRITADMMASTPVALSHYSAKSENVPIFTLTSQPHNRLVGVLLDPNNRCRGRKEFNLYARDRTPEKIVWLVPQSDFHRTDLSFMKHRFFQHAPITGPFHLANGRIADVLILNHGRSYDGSNTAKSRYQFIVDVLALDIAEAKQPFPCLITAEYSYFQDLDISEKMQPLSLLATKAGNGLIGMRAEAGELAFHELWFNEQKPRITKNLRPPSGIHASFAERPPLVLRPGSDGADSDATIVVSRALITASSRSQRSETVRMDFATLGRNGNGWSLSRAAACKVTYKIASVSPIGDCGVARPTQHWLTKEPGIDTISMSIGNRLRAGQLLAGHLLDKSGTLTAVDACLASKPILLKARSDKSFDPDALSQVDDNRIDRQVTCRPLPAMCLMEKPDSPKFAKGGPCSDEA